MEIAPAKNSAKPRRKNTLAFLRDVTLILLLIPALWVLSFGAALLQEKDTFALIVAATKIHLRGGEMQSVTGHETRWLLRSGLDGVPLDKHFAARGWRRAKQQSLVRFYRRDGHVIYVRFKPYTARYTIAQADREP
jgi:hypothetical protein